MIAVDLFAGCGGLSLGLKQAKFNVIAAVEIEPLAATAYSLNHQKTRLFQKDIRQLPPRDLRKKLSLVRGELDLLAGCPPCQGFSSLRTLNGYLDIHDERNNLVETFGDFVEVLKPKTVLLENVPGLVNDTRLIALVDRLRDLGYGEPVVGILDAADYSVPQRRRRTLLMASRTGVLSFPKAVRHRKTVREAIAALPRPGKSGDPAHDLTPNHSEAVLELIRQIPKNGGSRAALGPERQLPCHQRTRGFCDVYGRMAWDDVAPTITSGCINPSKGRFIHPDQNRGITLREAAILQSFPRSYVVPVTRGINPAALLIGNAFPPEFARRQALQLRKLLTST